MSILLALLLPLCSTAVDSSTDQCLMQLRGTLIRHKLVESLEACLHAGAALVTAQGEQGYDEAKQCINQRPDIVPSPLAVVQVASVAEVQKAVSCAAAQGVQVCARAGGHGFDNDAGCSGGVVIDVRGLNSFSVDTETKVTTFGAGLCLGQLYYKLAQHGLLVPGGTVNGVGAAGLILELLRLLGLRLGRTLLGDLPDDHPVRPVVDAYFETVFESMLTALEVLLRGFDWTESITMPLLFKLMPQHLA